MRDFAFTLPYWSLQATRGSPSTPSQGGGQTHGLNAGKLWSADVLVSFLSAGITPPAFNYLFLYTINWRKLGNMSSSHVRVRGFWL